jgi:hypothetical protein
MSSVFSCKHERSKVSNEQQIKQLHAKIGKKDFLQNVHEKLGKNRGLR